MHLARFTVTLLVVAAAALLPACVAYRTPGGPADFRALGITPSQADQLTDESIAAVLSRQPAAAFPAAIAVARVQGAGYYSYTNSGYGSGRFTLVTVRDVETPEQIERLEKLPMIRAVAALNRLVVPSDIRTQHDLRMAAAQLKADILVLYTFDTRFGVETTIPGLGLITLGLFPNEEARVTSTASAAILDTRTGFVYGLAEATAHRNRLANAWTTREATDRARLDAERDAFAALVGNIESTWFAVAQEYAITPMAEAAARPAATPDTHQPRPDEPPAAGWYQGPGR